ncbi:hypothetical protein [Desulfovibrio litoralis]|nr:hypothetical protein [Desulfovibrio litoralis]
MRKLKLMCDYYCYPLWDSESDEYNIDPLSLNISQTLNAQLMT